MLNLRYDRFRALSDSAITDLYCICYSTEGRRFMVKELCESRLLPCPVAGVRLTQFLTHKFTQLSYSSANDRTWLPDRDDSHWDFGECHPKDTIVVPFIPLLELEQFSNPSPVTLLCSIITVSHRYRVHQSYKRILLRKDYVEGKLRRGCKATGSLRH